MDEQEANRVADQVMATQAPVVHGKCAAGDEKAGGHHLDNWLILYLRYYLWYPTFHLQILKNRPAPQSHIRHV